MLLKPHDLHARLPDSSATMPHAVTQINIMLAGIAGLHAGCLRDEHHAPRTYTRTHHGSLEYMMSRTPEHHGMGRQTRCRARHTLPHGGDSRQDVSWARSVKHDASSLQHAVGARPARPAGCLPYHTSCPAAGGTRHDVCPFPHPSHFLLCYTAARSLLLMLATTQPRPACGNMAETQSKASNTVVMLTFERG